MGKRSTLSRFLLECFGEKESACGDVFTPRCSVLYPESQSLHAFIYCVNGGEQTRRNTPGRGPTLSSGFLVSFPSQQLSSFLLFLHFFPFSVFMGPSGTFHPKLEALCECKMLNHGV